MTARTCAIHGEYSATGVCRWCEPAPAPRCRCGEYAWEPPCPPDMREGVIGGMFHSPAQCFKLDATPPEPEYEHTEAVITANMNAEEESRLLTQHAALRWERVAQRWNWKHRRAAGLDDADRSRVWLHWVDQMNRRYLYMTWKVKSGLLP